MRGRIVVFVVLAAVAVLVGVYIGGATAPKAAGQPAPTAPADASVGSTHAGTSRPTASHPAPSHSAASRSPGASRPKASPAQGAARPAGTATTPGHKPTTPPAAQPQPSAGPVRFGKVTTTPSDGVQTSVAERDRRALTTTFDDLQAGEEQVPQPDATRSFSMTLPLTDGAKGETLRVSVQGYAFVEKGAHAQLTLKVNGQGTVRYYEAGWNDTILEVLELPAVPATTYQLSGVLRVRHNSGTDSYAILNVVSVDAAIIS
jgi:hypothetical protein